ncbi:MAG: hypothetical protein AAGJ97_01685, partial [Planctomycetota bacterium]
ELRGQLGSFFHLLDRLSIRKTRRTHFESLSNQVPNRHSQSHSSRRHGKPSGLSPRLRAPHVFEIGPAKLRRNFALRAFAPETRTKYDKTAVPASFAASAKRLQAGGPQIVPQRSRSSLEEIPWDSRIGIEDVLRLLRPTIDQRLVES